MSGIPGLFVVGTDTGVGKTRIAVEIARSLVREGRRVGVLKPVASGATRCGDAWRSADADALALAIGVEPTEDVGPIAFAEPLAPTVAARRAGTLLTMKEVERATFSAIRRWEVDLGAEFLVVEGVGGLLCPLAEGTTVADLAIKLDYPLVVVARRGLGTLNHTQRTVEAALFRSLRIAGVILNGAEPTRDPIAEAENPAELARRLGPLGVPILAELPYDPANESTPVVMDGLNWYDRGSRSRFPVSIRIE